jgi:hypothetical protein
VPARGVPGPSAALAAMRMAGQPKTPWRDLAKSLGDWNLHRRSAAAGRNKPSGS